HLGNADATVLSRLQGKVDKQGVRVRAGHLEPRDDASPTGEHEDRESLLGVLAIYLDLHSRTLDVVEEDGLVVQKACTADVARVVRELTSFTPARVEAEDLIRVLAGSVWAEVEQRDVPAVGADREGIATGSPGTAWNAAGQTEPPEPPPVGAHEEEALFRWPPDSWEPGPLARHLEDHPRAVRQHREALEEAEVLGRPSAIAVLAEAAAQPLRIGLRITRIQLLDWDRVAVPAP